MGQANGVEEESDPSSFKSWVDGFCNLLLSPPDQARNKWLQRRRRRRVCGWGHVTRSSSPPQLASLRERMLGGTNWSWNLKKRFSERWFSDQFTSTLSLLDSSGFVMCVCAVESKWVKSKFVSPWVVVGGERFEYRITIQSHRYIPPTNSTMHKFGPVIASPIFDCRIPPPPNILFPTDISFFQELFNSGCPPTLYLFCPGNTSRGQLYVLRITNS